VEIRVIESEGVRRTADCVFSAEEYASRRRKVLAETTGGLSIPGFRPGKAPAAMVEKMWAKKIEDGVFHQLAEIARSAMGKREDLTIIAYGEMKLLPPEANGDVVLQISFTVRPEVQLPDFSAIEFPTINGEAPEEKVEKLLEKIIRFHGSLRPVQRPIAAGDMVRVAHVARIPEGFHAPENPSREHFCGRGESVELIGGRSIAEDSIPGLVGNAKGKCSGEKYPFHAEFPEDFPETWLAGKSLDYDCEILKVEECIPPDENGKVREVPDVREGMDKLRRRVRRHLFRKNVDAGMRRQREHIRRYLVENTILSAIPEDILEEECQFFREGLVQRNLKRGVPLKNIELEEAKIDAAARQQAREMVSAWLIGTEIASKEGLSVDDRNLNEVAYAMAQLEEISAEEFRMRFKRDEHLRSTVMRQAFLSKAVDFIHEKFFQPGSWNCGSLLGEECGWRGGEKGTSGGGDFAAKSMYRQLGEIFADDSEDEIVANMENMMEVVEFFGRMSEDAGDEIHE
jgi:trigger factor